MCLKYILMLNGIVLVLFRSFEAPNENVFSQKDDVSGKIFKSIKTESKTECLLRCKNFQSFATFTENTCNCISLENVSTESKYSIYKETG